MTHQKKHTFIDDGNGKCKFCPEGRTLKSHIFTQPEAIRGHSVFEADEIDIYNGNFIATKAPDSDDL